MQGLKKWTTRALIPSLTPEMSNTTLKPENRLTRAQRELLGEFIEITMPFDTMLLNLHQNHRPAISEVDPFIYGLRRELLAHIQKSGELEVYAADLLASFEQRLGRVEVDTLYIAATFHDPKYKLRWCKHLGDERKA